MQGLGFHRGERKISTETKQEGGGLKDAKRFGWEGVSHCEIPSSQVGKASCHAHCGALGVYRAL